MTTDMPQSTPKELLCELRAMLDGAIANENFQVTVETSVTGERSQNIYLDKGLKVSKNSFESLPELATELHAYLDQLQGNIDLCRNVNPNSIYLVESAQDKKTKYLVIGDFAVIDRRQFLTK